MAQNGVEKPNVLILGGVGFIGRNLVHYLLKNDLTNKIRVVDKVMPQMAWLNAKHKEAFTKVEFKHANLINPKSVANAFVTTDGMKFDFVINCAAETRLGHSEEVYRDGIYKLGCNCAREAERQKSKVYIEVSTALMYSTDKKPIKEDTSCEPWTTQAKYKLAVEQDLRKMAGLNYIVLRPAILYGLGDKTGLTPRLVAGGIYKYLKEKMKMLWNKDYKMNTVHVHDVARAIWHLCNHGNKGEVYHLADKGDTTQGKVADIVSDLFGISHDYIGNLISTMAKMSIDEVVEDINDKHMTPWGEVCQQDGIATTPLSPYVEEEVLLNKQVYVDGSKIEATGFTYERPQLTKDLLKEVLDDYVEMALFPASLVKDT